MVLSCGNPVATANTKDIFLAASKVGPTGKVVGLDMSSTEINSFKMNNLRYIGLPADTYTDQIYCLHSYD